MLKIVEEYKGFTTVEYIDTDERVEKLKLIDYQADKIVEMLDIEEVIQQTPKWETHWNNIQSIYGDKQFYFTDLIGYLDNNVTGQ